MGLWQSIKSWLEAPFTTPLDTISIALITGIVIVAAIAWGFVLRDIEGAVREI